MQWGRRAYGGSVSAPSPQVEVSGENALGLSAEMIAAVSCTVLSSRSFRCCSWVVAMKS